MPRRVVAVSLVSVFMMAWACPLLEAQVKWGSPLPIDVTGPDGAALPGLHDVKTDVGVPVSKGSYTIRLRRQEPVIAFGAHIQAKGKGRLVVRCDDVMPRTIAFELGDRWYRLRLPSSNTAVLTVTGEGGEAVWTETEVMTRTPVTMRPASVAPQVMQVRIDVPTTRPAPTCDVPPGFMCNWFDRGLTEAMTRPEPRAELIGRLKEFGAGSIRYPGGCWTYGYPPYVDAVPVFVKAGMDTYAYGLRELNRFGWASAEDYFRFCRDAGMTAWYELNPGFWYDRTSRRVRKTIAMDQTKDTFPGDEIAQGVEQAVELARLAKQVGVRVVWEIGNEDYCYYTAPTYARLCSSFIEGIRGFDPDARFAVCGDSYSWSDWRFAEDLVGQLANRGVKRIDYSSQHLYMEGIWEPAGNTYRPRRWGTPQEAGDSAAGSWPNIRPLFVARPERFKATGIVGTRMAITEFNVYANAPSGEVEHSAGRALGEAEAICGILQDASALFFHDLVRTHPDETFYARLDYYPENPVGKRYYWFPEGAAASVVVHHAQGRIVHHAAGICASVGTSGVYVTCVNRGSTWRKAVIGLFNAAFADAKPAEVRVFRTAAAECCYFDYYVEQRRMTVPLAGKNLELESPPFSVVGLRIGLE